MTTNELEGRALHEAAARAMGWIPDGDQWHDDDGTWMADEYGPNERQLMAHLTKKGIVKAAMSAIACDVEFIPRLGTQSFDYMVTYPQAHGRDLREALARLVVAVKEREEAK